MDSIKKSRSKTAQVTDYIKSEIDKRGLAPGQRIVTTREFAEKLGVSKQVVQSAFLLLEKEGIIETKPRSGVFVAQGALEKLQNEAPRISLGMILHSEYGAYGMAVVKAVLDYADEQSIQITTVSVKNFGDGLQKKAHDLSRAGCSAILLPWVPPKSGEQIAALIDHSSLPISVPLYIKGYEKNSVKSPEMCLMNVGQNRRTGDTQLAEDACAYFHRIGEKNIILLGTTDLSLDSMKDKITGYSGYMDKLGLKKRIELVGPTAGEMDALASKIAKLKAGAGIVAISDIHAIRFMTAMHKLSLSAPNDFKIIGDIDTEEAKYCDPPLASARADFPRIGAEIVMCAVALAQGREWHSSWLGPKEIIVRESCGGLAPQAKAVLESMQADGVKITFEECHAQTV